MTCSDLLPTAMRLRSTDSHEIVADFIHFEALLNGYTKCKPFDDLAIY